MTARCTRPVVDPESNLAPTGPRFVRCCKEAGWSVYDVRRDNLQVVCDNHVLPYFNVPAFSDLVEYGLIRVILREE